MKKCGPYKTPERPRWQSLVDKLNNEVVYTTDKKTADPVKNLFRQYQEKPFNDSDIVLMDDLNDMPSISSGTGSSVPVLNGNNDKCVVQPEVLGGAVVDVNVIDSEEDTVPFDSGLGTSCKDYNCVGSEGDSDNGNKQGPLTPKGTPIKNLPFSPSQVI